MRFSLSFQSKLNRVYSMAHDNKIPPCTDYIEERKNDAFRVLSAAYDLLLAFRPTDKMFEVYYACM